MYSHLPHNERCIFWLVQQKEMYATFAMGAVFSFSPALIAEKWNVRKFLGLFAIYIDVNCIVWCPNLLAQVCCWQFQDLRGNNGLVFYSF